MNTSRLQQLFAHYIDKFEYINNPELNENYKWEIVKQYQDIFNLDAPDLAGMLTEAWRITSNLIDSQFQQPFYALIAYAARNRRPSAQCSVIFSLTTMAT